MGYVGRAGIDTDAIAQDAADAAEISEDSALASANNAASSETNASTSATAAALSETNAANSASDASTSETNAANSATASASSASSALTSANNASASETAAANSVASLNLPSNMLDKSGKALVVNSTEDGYEFGDAGGDPLYVLPSTGTTNYMVKGFEVVQNNFTPSGTWQLVPDSTLLISDLAVINSSGEYLETDTTIDNNYLFYDTLNLMSDATVTVSGTIQGIAGSNGTAVGNTVSVAAIDNYQSMAKLYYLGTRV